MAAEVRNSCSCVIFYHDSGNNGKDFFLAQGNFFGRTGRFWERSNSSSATSAAMYCENKHTYWAGGNVFVVNIATEVSRD